MRDEHVQTLLAGRADRVGRQTVIVRRKEFDAAVVKAARRLQRGKDVCNWESAVTGHLPVREAVGRERCPPRAVSGSHRKAELP